MDEYGIYGSTTKNTLELKLPSLHGIHLIRKNDQGVEGISHSETFESSIAVSAAMSPGDVKMVLLSNSGSCALFLTYHTETI